jgi:hypothetical protein
MQDDTDDECYRRHHEAKNAELHAVIAAAHRRVERRMTPRAPGRPVGGAVGRPRKGRPAGGGSGSSCTGGTASPAAWAAAASALGSVVDVSPVAAPAPADDAMCGGSSGVTDALPPPPIATTTPTDVDDDDDAMMGPPPPPAPPLHAAAEPPSPIEPEAPSGAAEDGPAAPLLPCNGGGGAVAHSPSSMRRGTRADSVMRAHESRGANGLSALKGPPGVCPVAVCADGDAAAATSAKPALRAVARA